MNALRLLAFMLAMSCCQQASAQGQGGTSAPSPDRTNLLTLAEGAVIVSASDNAPDALSLTDGSPQSSWKNSGRNPPLPYSFIFELRGPTVLGEVGIAGAGKRPGGVAGAAARSVTVEGSSSGPAAGFRRIASFEAAEEGETIAAVTDAMPVRWLKFTISTNHGAQIWTYVSDALARGRQAPPEKAPDFTGTFQTGRSDFVELKQDGGALAGCYTEQAGFTTGMLRGDIDRGVARLSWRSEKGIIGTAVFVLDSKGALHGVRYRDRSRSIWSGGRTTAAVTTPCSQTKPPANAVADALEKDGKALLYGILFDFDQATLRPESGPALQRLLEALKLNASLSLAIEGHTDSDGDDRYNLALSERRAKTVVAWLADQGVAATRLTAVGRGESQPVAGNATADGRALNRRVEAVRR